MLKIHLRDLRSLIREELTLEALGDGSLSLEDEKFSIMFDTAVMKAVDGFIKACKNDLEIADAVLNRVVGPRKSEPRLEAAFQDVCMNFDGSSLGIFVGLAHDITKYNSTLTKNRQLSPGFFAAAREELLELFTENSPVPDWQQDNPTQAEKLGETKLMIRYMTECWDVLSFVAEKVSNEGNVMSKDISPEYAETSDPKAPLGKIAFPKQRTDKSFPLEKNTPLEDKLEKLIGMHFSDNVPIPKPETNALKGMLKKGQYKKVINEPTDADIMRGMKVDDAWMQKLLKKKNVKDIPLRGEAKKKFKFTPRDGGSSSWSTDEDQARTFSYSHTASKPWQVILHADPYENKGKFLAGVGGLYRLRNAQDYTSEEEVVGVDTITVNKISWVHLDED